MAELSTQRRLAAILAADVVGYARLMGRDEAGTLTELKTRRREILEPLVAEHNGRVFKITGDGALIEFASAVNALQCAVNLQQAFAAANANMPEDQWIVLRIGMHVGDVLVEGSDLYGDGVNIAARLEALAEPGAILISEDVHRQIGSKLKLGFEDTGQQSLKNIAQPVRAYSVAGLSGRSVSRSAPPITAEKPSIAVLPFTNMSGDPEQEYFSDGITEDIITELARFRSLLVIARHSSFAFKGKAVTVLQVGRELGVEYVLEGSVRRAGNHVRITAQLIDARTNTHIWVERLDRDVDNLFVMQDEVTERIVATIANRLEKTEQERVARKHHGAMRAHDYILRARAIISETAETNRESRALYEKALALEPTNMLALTGMGWTYVIEWSSRWNDPTIDPLACAHQFARQALAVDSSDYRAHLLLGHIQANRSQFAEALTHYQQAMTLNSNDADGAAYMGGLFISLGRFSEALNWFQRAIRLNPFHPAWYLYGIGEAHYGAREYEKAIAPLRVAIDRFPNFITPRRHLAAAYAQLGLLTKARAEVAAICKLDPSVCLTIYRKRVRYEKADDLEHYLDGLRRAGMPE